MHDTRLAIGCLCVVLLFGSGTAWGWKSFDPVTGETFLSPVQVAIDPVGDVVVNDGGRTRMLSGAHGGERWALDTGFGDADVTSFGAVAGAYISSGCIAARLLDNAEGSAVWSFVDLTACSPLIDFTFYAYAQAATVDALDDVIVGGTVVPPPPPPPLVVPNQIHVFKVNGGSGTLAWRRSWPGGSLDELVTDANRDVFAFEASGELIKLDGDDGAELWRIEIDLTGRSLAVGPSGDLYVAGHDDTRTLRVLRVSAVGGATLATYVGTGASHVATALGTGPDVVVATDLDDALAVIRLDSTTLASLWQTTLVGTDDTEVSLPGGVTFDGGGDVAVTGALLNEKSGWDFLVAKLAGGSGGVLWTTQMAGPGNPGIGATFDFGRKVTADTSGNIVAAGMIPNPSDVFDNHHATVKLRGSDGGAFGGLFAGAICNSTVCGPCEVCVAPDTCAVGPRNDCEAPLTSTGSLLKLGDDPVTNVDRVNWKWGASSGVADAAVGDPRLETDYAICLFDDTGGTANLVWSRELPGLGLCGNRPCWQESKKAGSPDFKYLDKADGPLGRTTTRLKLRAGDAQQAKIVLKGKGPGIALPTLGLTAPVRMELRSSEGPCFTASYDADIQDNTPTFFKAKGGP
jgi:outer membrane protein assembly factor BamB